MLGSSFITINYPSPQKGSWHPLLGQSTCTGHYGSSSGPNAAESQQVIFHNDACQAPGYRYSCLPTSVAVWLGCAEILTVMPVMTCGTAKESWSPQRSWPPTRGASVLSALSQETCRTPAL
jgi:hypothetical protein